MWSKRRNGPSGQGNRDKGSLPAALNLDYRPPSVSLLAYQRTDKPKDGVKSLSRFYAEWGEFN